MMIAPNDKFAIICLLSNWVHTSVPDSLLIDASSSTYCQGGLAPFCWLFFSQCGWRARYGEWESLWIIRHIALPQHIVFSPVKWIPPSGQRLRAEVLDPLRAGQTATYQRFDWSQGQLGATVDVAASDCTLIEGVYSFRPELRAYYNYSIYIDTPREERLQRLRKRGDSETWIQRWTAAVQPLR